MASLRLGGWLAGESMDEVKSRTFITYFLASFLLSSSSKVNIKQQFYSNSDPFAETVMLTQLSAFDLQEKKTQKFTQIETPTKQHDINVSDHVRKNKVV